MDTQDTSESRVYELKHPIQFGAETVTRVQFKKVTPAMLDELPIDAREWKLRHTKQLMSALIGFPVKGFIEKLDGSDYFSMTAMTSGFLSEFLGTGEIESDSSEPSSTGLLPS